MRDDDDDDEGGQPSSVDLCKRKIRNLILKVYQRQTWIPHVHRIKETHRLHCKPDWIMRWCTRVVYDMPLSANMVMVVWPYYYTPAPHMKMMVINMKVRDRERRFICT